MSLVVKLVGDPRTPELLLPPFGFSDRYQGKKMTEWVKALPDRRWEPSSKRWYVTGTGGQFIDDFLAAQDFVVDRSEQSAELASFELIDLFVPKVRLDPADSSNVNIRPMLVGKTKVQERVGFGAIWDKNAGFFNAPVTELFESDGSAKQGLAVTDEMFEAAARMRAPLGLPADIEAAASALATHIGSDDKGKTLSEDAISHLRVVSKHTGRLPQWFGLALFPFQECGAYAVAAGHNLLADEPGLGKTRSALAAAAIRQASRVVVVCPPLVLTNWAREIRSAFEPGIHLPGTPMYRPVPPPAPVPRTKAEKKKAAAAEKKAKNSFPEWITIIRAGKKVPPIPETGFVVMPDSLLSSRPELLAELLQWAPEAAIFDEVHRARTWTSKRATACRTVASAVNERGGLTVPTTGTPILASPLELMNLLAMSGHLYRGWGSAGQYIEKYLRPQKFGGFAPKKRELKGLGDVLRANVWTRRNKKDVLTQLPPKWRTVRRVEINEAPFKEAHTALYEKMTVWIDEFFSDKGRWPATPDIQEFVQGRAIELMSPLRVAAGVAKIPAASEIIREWMEDTTITHDDGSKEYTRPLIVWAHHKQVLEAMAEALPSDLCAVGVISGSTSSQRRQELADEFQAGKLGVLVCSIIAAGFGLTLTRSSDAIFIEQDWTPAQISQAEDRISRIGQVKPCMITTLYADNTLDPSLRAVLMNKGDILEAITPGSDNRVTKVTAIETEDTYEEFTGEDVELARSVKNTDEIVTAIIEHILFDRRAKMPVPA